MPLAEKKELAKIRKSLKAAEDKLDKVISEERQLIDSIAARRLELEELNNLVKEREEFTKNFEEDFILPREYTEDLIDVELKTENIKDGYGRITNELSIALILYKEKTFISFWRKKKIKHWFQKVDMGTTPPKGNGDWKKAVKYKNALKKHILSKKSGISNKISLTEAKEALVSAEHLKDAFILKIINSLK